VVPEYDLDLAALSIGIAILASYTALDLSGRVVAASDRGRYGWLAAGAVAMGVGIWSMHFTGMLAHEPLEDARYDLGVVLISVAIAILASGAALAAINRPKVTLAEFLASGLFFGVAIAGMHYTGMLALHTRQELEYDVPGVIFSVVVAVVASLFALRLVVLHRYDRRNRPWLRLGAAVMMGVGVAGMHYSAMAAVTVLPHGHPFDVPAAANGLRIDIQVVLGTLLVLGLSLIGAKLDRERAQAIAEAKALRQSERRLRTLAESLPSIVWTATPEGVIDYVSERWYAYTNEPRGDVITFETVVHPHDRTPMEAAWRQALANGGTYEITYRLRRRDGEYRWHIGRAERLCAKDGRTIAWFGTATDIHDQHLAQEAIRERDETQRVLDAQRMLAAHIEAERFRIGQELHDGIRQQLTGIQMLGKSLGRRLAAAGDPSADTVEDFTRAIGDANAEVRRLISGLVPKRIAPGELPAALERAASEAERWFSVRCRVHVDDDAVPRDDEAATHLFYIAQEAVTNAGKHSGSDVIDVRLVRGDRGLELHVRDCGRGLPPDFESRGGLGIQSLRNRADLIGADVAFDSRDGSGTLVRCTVPEAA
jgi:PAS domain S-box-containing protein